MADKWASGSPASGAGSAVSPYTRIRQAIIDGELRAGAPLIEATLAEWCQVSRTPIREALTRLEQDGLVIRNERGLIVRERTHEEILDIYETRIVLEGAAARAAAIRRSPVDLIQLSRVADAMDGVRPGDIHAMVSTNRAFHRALWRASHNHSLIELLTRLDFQAIYPKTTLSWQGRWEQASQEHRAIISAVEDQDEVRAAEVAQEHFAHARNIRLAMIAAEDLQPGSI